MRSLLPRYLGFTRFIQTVFHWLLSMSRSPRSRKVAIALAFAGAFTPTPVPLSGLHKFYVGQPGWGFLYLLLGWTQIPRIASAIEAVWYLSQTDETFAARLPTKHSQSLGSTPSGSTNPAQVGAIADALRQLDQLRQEGLISEYEFEQKRRNLLDQIA